MSIRLDSDGLAVDHVWSPVEYSSFQQEIVEHGQPFGYYQNVRIRDREGKRLETPGPHPTAGVIEVLDQAGFPKSFRGKSVLDIGCNAGFYSTVAAIRGADRVVGLDHQPLSIGQALMLRKILAISDQTLQFQVADGYDLSPDRGQFDCVINTGVLYHLENPMDFLRRVASITAEVMYLESEALLDSKYSEYAWFIEGAYAGDRSNWWVYGPTCLERMVRAAGFRHVEFRGFIWTPPPGTQTAEGYLRQGRAFFICRK